MDDGDAVFRLGPHEVALLRGGDRAAVVTAVVDLHLRGVVEAGRPGTMRTSEASTEGAGTDLPPLCPLARPVRQALHEPCGLPEVLRAADVRRALAGLRAELRAAGLLRVLPPRRTGAARRGLDALLAQHPLPTTRRGLSATETLFVLALHGEAALTVLVPRFALRAGLTRRAEVADKGFHRRAPRSDGSSGAGHHCGSGASSCGGTY